VHFMNGRVSLILRKQWRSPNIESKMAVDGK
jgi:hypothetical protein